LVCFIMNTIITFFIIYVCAQSFPLYSSWAHEMLTSMSLKEKIGQLIVLRVNMGSDIDDVMGIIQEYSIGAIIPLSRRINRIHWDFEGHKELVENLNSLYPSMSRTPVMIIADAEWGCAMRIPELIAFPKLMTLGAIPFEKEYLIYEVGKAIGMQCATLGIHINCAPVVDVNSNPANPVIGMRSFGDNPVAVTRKALLYAQGLSDSGIIPCFKHFPGHGNTYVDSHVSLPVIDADSAYIWQHDLVPFQVLRDKRSYACMIGHLAVPALESKRKVQPASISFDIVEGLLKRKLGFEGLILTDALDMYALNSFGNSGQVSLAALKAGVDLLLCPPVIAMVVRYIEQAIKEGTYTEKELDEHVLKILTVKEKLGLHKVEHIVRREPFNDYKELIQEAYDAAVTVCNHRKSVLSMYSNQSECESVMVGASTTQTIRLYNPHTQYTKPLLVHVYPGNYATHRLSRDILHRLESLATQEQPVLILLFGSPYCLCDIPSDMPVLVLYENVSFAHITAQKVLSSTIMPTGILPILIK
jgi:beta-N-acetylhexosaminidase